MTTEMTTTVSEKDLPKICREVLHGQEMAMRAQVRLK
jgi:hypothetical protein